MLAHAMAHVCTNAHPYGRPLRVRALERLRAQALSLSWKLDEPLVEISEGLRASPQDLDMELKGTEEAKATETEEKAEVSRCPGGPGAASVPGRWF